MSKASKQKKAPKDTHEDGPVIPAQLLGELRETFKRYQAALASVQEHNERGQQIQKEAVNAEAVYRFFVDRLTKKFSLVDGDLLDLDRGVVRKKLDTVESA